MDKHFKQPPLNTKTSKGQKNDVWDQQRRPPQVKNHNQNHNRNHHSDDNDSHEDNGTYSTIEDSVFHDPPHDSRHHPRNCHKQNHHSLSTSSTSITSSSPSSSSFSSSSSSSFSSSSSSSRTSSASSSSSSGSSDSERSNPRSKPQHSRSCNDISRKTKYLDEGDDTAPLLEGDDNLNRKTKHGTTPRSAQSHGKHIIDDGSVRKAKSMEALPRPKQKEEEKRKNEARKNIVKEKIKFSAFLNEVTRHVLSPMRLTTLGVTNAQRPTSPGQASGRSTKSVNSTVKQEQQKQGSVDSASSGRRSRGSSKHSHSRQRHYSHRTEGSPDRKTRRSFKRHHSWSYRERSCSPSSKHHHHYHHHHRRHGSPSYEKDHQHHRNCGRHHSPTNYHHDHGKTSHHQNKHYDDDHDDHHHSAPRYYKDQSAPEHGYNGYHRKSHHSEQRDTRHLRERSTSPYHHRHRNDPGDYNKGSTNDNHHGDHHDPGYYHNERDPQHVAHHKDHHHSEPRHHHAHGHHQHQHREPRHQSERYHGHHSRKHHPGTECCQGHHHDHNLYHNSESMHHHSHKDHHAPQHHDHQEDHHSEPNHYHRDHHNSPYHHHGDHHNEPHHHHGDNHDDPHHHHGDNHDEPHHRHGDHHFEPHHHHRDNHDEPHHHHGDNHDEHHHHHGDHHNEPHHHHGDHHSEPHHHQGDNHDEPHRRHGDHRNESHNQHGDHHSEPHHHQGDHHDEPHHRHGDHRNEPHHRHGDHHNEPHNYHGDRHNESHNHRGDHYNEPHHYHGDHQSEPHHHRGDHHNEPHHYHGDHHSEPHHRHKDHHHELDACLQKHLEGHSKSNFGSRSPQVHSKTNQSHTDHERHGKPIDKTLESLQDLTSQNEEQTSFTGPLRKENADGMGRIIIVQEQNEGLQQSLLKTAVRVECLGEEFMSSRNCLESELQRTRLELSSLTERFKRLHDNCSSTQQTNSLLEHKLHLVAQSMEGERERLNQRISALTEKLADAKFVNSVDTNNVVQHQVDSGVPPITPPPAQFMDNFAYAKDKAAGQEQSLGSVPEEEESDWSEIGEETPRFVLTGLNRGQVWRRRQSDIDKADEPGSEGVFRPHSPRPTPVPHLQLSVHDELLPFAPNDLSDIATCESSYTFAASPSLGSAVLFRSASLEDIPLARHSMHKELQGTEAMMDLHHSGAGAVHDIENEIIHHLRTNRESDMDAAMSNLQSAERILNHLISETHHSEGKGEGRAEVQGWSEGIPDDLLKGERTKL